MHARKYAIPIDSLGLEFEVSTRALVLSRKSCMWSMPDMICWQKTVLYIVNLLVNLQA